MRPFIIFFLFSLTACHPSVSQFKSNDMTPDQAAVEQTLSEFLTAGDLSSVDRLDAVLDPAYRITVNQFMGGEGVTVIDRSTYLQMISAGKLGGTPRSVELKSIEVVGNIAHVRAALTSDQLIFDSHYTFAQDKSGNWKLISDTPFVTPR